MSKSKKNYLEGVKIGQQLYSIIHGISYVREVRPNEMCQVLCATMDGMTFSCTFEGKRTTRDKDSTVFYEKPHMTNVGAMYCNPDPISEDEYQKMFGVFLAKKGTFYNWISVDDKTLQPRNVCHANTDMLIVLIDIARHDRDSYFLGGDHQKPLYLSRFVNASWQGIYERAIKHDEFLNKTLVK